MARVGVETAGRNVRRMVCVPHEAPSSPLSAISEARRELRLLRMSVLSWGTDFTCYRLVRLAGGRSLQRSMGHLCSCGASLLNTRIRRPAMQLAEDSDSEFNSEVRHLTRRSDPGAVACSVRPIMRGICGLGHAASGLAGFASAMHGLHFGVLRAFKADELTDQPPSGAATPRSTGAAPALAPS